MSEDYSQLEENSELTNNTEKAAMTIDRQTLDIMIEALRQHDAAKDLNTEILEDICIEALTEGKMNDFQWLASKIKEVTGEEVDLQTPQVDNPIGQSENTDYLEKIKVSKPIQVENREHLQEVLIQHEIWMNSVLNPREEISGGRANLRGADLQGYDLIAVNLSCADLRGANLMGANLTKANLSNTWLQDTNLQGANLTGAKLKKAKLENSDLREADLTDVNLDEVDMSKAILKDSDLKGRKKQENKLANIQSAAVEYQETEEIDEEHEALINDIDKILADEDNAIESHIETTSAEPSPSEIN